MTKETPQDVVASTAKAEKEEGDRTWLVLCTATGVAVDVTLNKYSSSLPGLAVVGIWAVPAVLFVIWFTRVESTQQWVKTRFLEHPVSYVLMFLIIIPFGWGATSTMVAKLLGAPKTPETQLAPLTQASPVTNPSQSVSSQPVIGAIVTAPHTHATLPPKKQQQGNLNDKPLADSPLTTVPVVQPPTFGQTCIGSACAQGPGAQATFNQLGTPERRIASKYVTEITPVLTAHPGFAVITSNSNNDQLTQQIYQLFVDAGWKNIMIGSVMGQAFQDGVVVGYRGAKGQRALLLRYPMTVLMLERLCTR